MAEDNKKPEAEDVATEQSVATASQNWLDVFNGEQNDEEVQEASPEQQEAESTESEEETTEEDQEEQVVEDDELVKTQKRLKDTQKWANESNQLLQEIQKKLEAGEELTAEDLAAIKASKPVESGTDEYVQFINDTAAQYENDIPMIVQFSDDSEEDVRAYAKAFGEVGLTDPEVAAELQNLQPNERTAFIVKKGKEFKAAHDFLIEKGSYAQALASVVADQSSKLDAKFEEGREAGLKEAEAKYKDYVSPTTRKKPKLRSNPTPNSEAAEQRTITNSDISKMFQR